MSAIDKWKWAESLGKLMETYRIKKELTQVEVATKIGCSQSLVSKVEKGKVLSLPIIIWYLSYVVPGYALIEWLEKEDLRRDDV